MDEMQDLARRGQDASSHRPLDGDAVHRGSWRQLSHRGNTRVRREVVDRADDPLRELADQRKVLTQDFQLTATIEIDSLGNTSPYPALGLV